MGLVSQKGGITGILLLFSIPFPKAIAFTIIFRLATLIFPVILGTILLLIFYGKQYFSREKNKLIQKQHSWHIIFILLFIIVVGSCLTYFYVINFPWIKQFDAFFYGLINGLPHTKLMENVIYPFHRNFLPFGAGFLPSYFYIWILTFLIFVYIKKRSEFKWAVLSIIIATFIGIILYKFSQNFLFRERPFTLLPNNVDEATKKGLMHWPSFPSGHVRDTMLYSLLIAHYFPETLYFGIFFTLFIAFCRLFEGVHYPTDVLAGIIIGYLLSKVTVLIIKEIQLLFKIIPNDQIK